MPDSVAFLTAIAPLPDGFQATPSIVLGHGSERHLFSLGPGDTPGGFVVAVDTMYGSARAFRDELATAILYHENLVVITRERKVSDMRFFGTVFDIIDNEGRHYLEMELGCAALDRGFSVIWTCDVPDIVNWMRFRDGMIEMDLFEGGTIVIDAVDGQEIEFRKP
jgi:hypothetical protein